MQQVLRESEGRFRELLEDVQLVAAMTDRDGKISFCNDYTLTITGWSRAEVIGRPAEQLFEPAPPFGSDGRVANVKRGDQTRVFFEGSILEKNGGRRSIQWTCTPLRDLAGRPAGFASLGQDVTANPRPAPRSGTARERSAFSTGGGHCAAYDLGSRLRRWMHVR